MKKEQIGRHAGIIWVTLHSAEREMTIEELSGATGLSVIEVAKAIGWLARENQIACRERDGANSFATHVEYYY